MNSRAKRVLIANGVNLDLLGKREPAIYGTKTLRDLEEQLRTSVEPIANIAGTGVPQLEFLQTNDEKQFLESLSRNWDGALINPGAWTHTSLALGDRLAGLDLPFIEVHLSNLAKREAFRHHSYVSPHAKGIVQGLGFDSYEVALLGLLRIIR